MAGLEITCTVVTEGSVHDALSAEVHDEVPAIQLGPNPCGFCRRNAESDDPILPPVHNDWNGKPNCHCTLVMVPVSEVITAAF